MRRSDPRAAPRPELLEALRGMRLLLGPRRTAEPDKKASPPRPRTSANVSPPWLTANPPLRRGRPKAPQRTAAIAAPLPLAVGQNEPLRAAANSAPAGREGPSGPTASLSTPPRSNGNRLLPGYSFSQPPSGSGQGKLRSWVKDLFSRPSPIERESARLRKEGMRSLAELGLGVEDLLAETKQGRIPIVRLVLSGDGSLVRSEELPRGNGQPDLNTQLVFLDLKTQHARLADLTQLLESLSYRKVATQHPFAPLASLHQLIRRVVIDRGYDSSNRPELTGLQAALDNLLFFGEIKTTQLQQALDRDDLAEAIQATQEMLNLLTSPDTVEKALERLQLTPLQQMPNGIKPLLRQVQFELLRLQNTGRQFLQLGKVPALPDKPLPLAQLFAKSYRDSLPVTVREADDFSAPPVPAASLWRYLHDLAATGHLHEAKEMIISFSSLPESRDMVIKVMLDDPRPIQIDPESIQAINKEFQGRLDTSQEKQWSVFTLTIPQNQPSDGALSENGESDLLPSIPTTTSPPPDIKRLRTIMHDLSEPFISANFEVNILSSRYVPELKPWLTGFFNLKKKFSDKREPYGNVEKTEENIPAILAIIRSLGNLQPMAEKVRTDLARLISQGTTFDSGTKQRLADIQRNLGDFISGLEALSGKGGPAIYGIGELYPLATLLEEFRRDYTSRISVTVTLAPSVQEAKVHSSTFKTVLQNLLTNAHEAGATTISIDVRQSDDTLIVKVHDNGPGISGDRFPNPDDIFLEGASSKGTGRGLGLDIVRRELDLKVGGTIEVANLPEGGALFTIRLPLLHLEP